MEKPEIITLKKREITDFAYERNRLLSKSKSKWILFLDSDESIPDSAFQVPNSADGYKIKRNNYFLGKFVGYDWIVRLGRREAGGWKRRVHEFWDIKNTPHLQDVIIKHNTADNLRDYVGKINFYSTLHAKANKEEGKRSSVFKIVFFPCIKFFQTLIKSKNIVFSIMQSFHSFLSWSKLFFLHS